MGKKKEKSLEEITEEAESSWGKQLPQFIPLIDFETKIKTIARKYGGDDTIHQEGSHMNIRILGIKVGWSLRQRGNESVLSSGTFEDAVERTSEATNIPCSRLRLYFKGSGKPYKRYKRKFEEEYDL